MEERLRFDGSLNLSQGNLPNEDYSDAQNIVITEGSSGDADVVKKLESILEYSDLSKFGTEKASTIDDDGNQYILMTDPSRIIYTIELPAEAIELGAEVYQPSGARGIVIDVDSITFVYKVFDLGGIAFSDAVELESDIPTNVTIEILSISSSTLNMAHILSVGELGSPELKVVYDLPNFNANNFDPDLKLINEVLIWNFLNNGTPLSFSVDRELTYFNDSSDLTDLYLIKKPPVFLSAIPNNTTTNGSLDVFEINTFDFAARYVYDSGEVSALSPFQTIRASSERTSTDFGIDGINGVVLSINGLAPAFTDKIQYFARVNNGSFRRIETVAPDQSVTFIGQLGESLSTDESNKIFDSVPISAKAIEISKNRVFLGNIVDDLGAEDENVTLTITGDVQSDHFIAGSPTIISIDDPVFYTEPTTIGDDVDGGATTEYTQDREVLTNDSLYRLGVIYQDEFLRTRGVTPSSIEEFKTANFDFPSGINELAISASNIPSWAKYAQVVMTRNLSKDFSIESYANGIFYQLEDTKGVLYFSNFAPEGITVDSIVIDAEISYTYQSGDQINLLFPNGVKGRLSIKSVSSGLIFCDPDPEFVGMKLGIRDLYFEIYSPKNSLSEDSTLFFETGIIVDVSNLPETITDRTELKKITDQIYYKSKVNIPVFRKCLDSETTYHFDGDADPTVQEGLPITTNGALIYSRTDDTQEAVIDSVSHHDWDGLHTNDPRELLSEVFWVDHTAHGYSEGTVNPIPNNITNNLYVLRVIDSNNYIASIPFITLVMADTSGFTEGDTIIIDSSLGDITCILSQVVSATVVAIANITYEESRRDFSSYNSISNGTATQIVTSVGGFIVSLNSANFGVDEGSEDGIENRTMYSTDKCYAGRNKFANKDIFPYAWNDDSAFGSDLIRFRAIETVVLPAKSGNAKIFYDIRISADAGNTTFIRPFIRQNFGAPSILLTDINAGETVNSSGVIELELDTEQMKQFGLILSSGNGTTGQDYTIHKGSYIYAVLDEDLITSTVQSDKEESWFMSRNLNARKNNDITWDRNSGKPTLEDTRIESRTFETKIRHGGKFIEDALINPISSFDSSDQDSVSEESGAITSLVRTNKIDSIGSVLVALCEREANSIYVGERIVTNNDGSTSLVVSDSVIGSIQPLQGSHGCIHKNSIAKDQNGNFTYWDNYNRGVIRYSREGLTVISDFKVKPFFQDKSGSVISFYDGYHDMYFFRFETAGTTISYKQGFGWVGFHDMDFNLGGEQFNDRSYPINSGIIYKTLGADYGKYLDDNTDKVSSITLNKNNQQNFIPTFLRLRGDFIDLATYSVEDISVEITNDLGQSTTMDGNFFYIEGSYIFSDVYRDENSVGGISNGIPLNSSNLKIKIILPDDITRHQGLREAYLGFEMVSY